MSSPRSPLSIALEVPLQWPSLEQDLNRMDALMAVTRHHDALWVGAQLEAIVESWPDGVDRATFQQVWDKTEEEGVKVKIFCSMLHDPARVLSEIKGWQRTEHIDALYEWEGGIDVYVQASRSTMKLFNDLVGNDPLSKHDVDVLRESLPARVFGPKVFAQACSKLLEEGLPTTPSVPKPRM